MSWEPGSQIPRKNGYITNEELLAKTGFLEEREAKLLLYQFLRQNITFTTDLLMGVKLFPFQHIAIKSMLESDYSLNVWSRGLSKCILENSLIATSQGIKKIIDISIGEKVLSKDGWNTVQDKVINPSQPTFKLKTRRGYECEGLDYHKVLILTKDLDLEWKKITDIQIGDHVAMKKQEVDYQQIDFRAGFCFKRSSLKQVIIDPYLLSDQEWYYFFGILLGDGCFTDRIISISTADQEITEFFKSFCSKLGLNLKSYQKEGNKATDYVLNNSSLKYFLVHCGFTPKTKAVKKTIPYKLLKCSSENLRLLLRGLFDTDGYCSRSPIRRNSNGARVGFTSCSEELIRQVRFLLLCCGIESRTHLSFKGGISNFSQGQYICNKAWSIIINDHHNVKIFKEKIGFNILRKSSILKTLDEAKYSEGEFSNCIPYIGEYLTKQYKRKGFCNKEKVKCVFRKRTSHRLLERTLPFLSDKDKEKCSLLLQDGLFFDEIKEISQGSGVTVDIQVENEHCYVSDGFINHNSFTAGIYAAIDCILNQGIEIGILSRSYRQSKMIFRKIEDIAAKPEAAFLKQCITKISKNNDEWIMELGSSRIRALPLGDGEKLRGFRFNRILIDEFLLMPDRIYNEVIIPFLSVVQNPTQREELHKAETALIELGQMKEEERYIWPNNKLIALSSASFKFEYLYKLYEQFETLITNPKKEDTTRRCIIQLSYDCAPEQLYDQNLINQAKSSMSESQFLREFGAQFTDDSSGYFKISKMALCTIPDGEKPSVEVCGHSQDEYIVSVDPSWSETESSDDFAIQVLKINREKQIATLVHPYALPGASLKDHIRYFLYILQNFNVVAIVMDYNGGVQFMSSCNESELFKSANIELKALTTEFEKPEEYTQNLASAKAEYNKSNYKYVILRKPTSSWIRLANELLQANLDHRRIFFASRAIDDDFRAQSRKKIGISELKFSPSADFERESDEAKMIDFIEHLSDMILMTKTQCALIQISTSSQGLQTFDLPHNLKRKTGPDKPRKDSYSALVLGNWLAKIFFDMETVKLEDVSATFTPFFIR